MKKVIVFFFITQISLSLCFAQSYNIIDNNKIYLYNNGGYINAVKVDSIKVQNEENVFYHFNMYRDSYYLINECIDVYGGSLLGKRNILTQDSVFKIITYFKDTVYIKPSAHLFDSWKLYKWSNGNYIEAAVRDISNQTVLGQTEEVKTITFYVKNSSGVIIESNPYNLKTILLSKYHGLIKTYDFYLFPNNENVYNLIDITNQTENANNIVKKIYNYNIGDIFHTVTKDLFYSHNGVSYYISNGYVKYNIREVIDKELLNSGNYIKYTYKNCYKYESYYSGYNTYISGDTSSEIIDITIIHNNVFSQLPMQTFKTSNNLYPYKIFQEVIKYQMGNRIDFCYEDRLDVVLNDTCWGGAYIDPMPTFYEYFEGCGGPYSAYDDWYGNVDSYKLVYYKKGSEEWGTPLSPDCERLNIDNITIDKSNPEISVFPNPCNQYIDVNVKNIKQPQITMELYNIEGKLIESYIINSNLSNRLNLSNLDKGIYFAKFYTIDFNSYSKIVKSE